MAPGPARKGFKRVSAPSTLPSHADEDSGTPESAATHVRASPYLQLLNAALWIATASFMIALGALIVWRALHSLSATPAPSSAAVQQLVHPAPSPHNFPLTSASVRPSPPLPQHGMPSPPPPPPPPLSPPLCSPPPLSSSPPPPPLLPATRLAHSPPCSLAAASSPPPVLIPSAVAINPKASNPAQVLQRYMSMGLDEEQWDDYLLAIYQAERSQLTTSLPRIDQVDLVYSMVIDVDNIDDSQYFDCAMKRNVPYSHAAPHHPLVAWLYRPPPFPPVPDHTWAEVTHCSGSAYEAHSSWFYVVTGSALYVNVGRTIAFPSHEAAVKHFLQRPCINNKQDQCNEELVNDLPAAALAAGYTSIQILLHRDFDCWDDDFDRNGVGHELMIIQRTPEGALGLHGDLACPPGVEFRTGVGASLPCDCVTTSALVSSRGKCAVCAGSYVQLGKHMH
ncbi:hypothetical protein AB1Y20_020933 [Prymnesium parvum]|uniref:Uncharacterized protein n=1 Tax=Prymnesium parvum TaxID=97485 RepID=A0AB34JHA4_PRYPA